MASGTATTPVAISQDMITGFSSDAEGAKVLTVSYEGFTKTFGVSVVDNLKGIVLVTLPNKLDYKYGESLNVAGGTIALIKDSGTSNPIPITKEMISGYNPNKLGNQVITITYEGFTQEFVVNVEDYISHLKVNKPKKTNYEYGEELDLSGGSVAIVMASGKIQEETPMTASMLSVFDNKKVGKQEIAVEYKGLKGSFTLTVEDKVKGIAMKELPNKVEYEYEESLDVTGATIYVVKSSGIYTEEVTSKMTSGFTPKKSGAQVVTVTYEGFKTQFVVSVKPQPQKPSEPTSPSKPDKPTKPSTSRPIIIQNITTPKEEKPEEPQEPTKPVETPTPTPTPTPDNTQKPTAVLGEKEENKGSNDKLLAGILGGAGMLLLLALILMRRYNVKIYVEEDGEFELGGVDKLTKKNIIINIDRCLDGENYQNPVKVYLKDSISEKLDGKEIEIKHRGEIIRYKIVYQDKPIEILLK